MARLVGNGQRSADVKLTYAGQRSTLAGQLPLTVNGPVTLQILAMDADNANFGLHERTLSVKP